MCVTCGCDANGQEKITKVDHDHTHAHAHHHDHSHTHEQTTVVQLEQDILHKNNLLAERNRGYFMAKEITAFNLVSSPGSGKTTLMERTLTDLKGKQPFYVIEGDQQTTNDAQRIAATGTPVVQINTGKGCHLEASMIADALRTLKPEDGSAVFIENVGNLVCPSMFDLGENKRIVLISTTEGEDKPLKYPNMFAGSDLCIINKIDLLPYLNISVDQIKTYATQINPRLQFLEVSCTTGQGLDEWYHWLAHQLGHAHSHDHAHHHHHH
ncbi:MAG: hydrogenase nickel incorporation protein HypB [Bernardetiaceae bacterium]